MMSPWLSLLLPGILVSTTVGDPPRELARRSLDALAMVTPREHPLVLRVRGERDLTVLLQGMHPARPEWVPTERTLALDPGPGRVAWETHGKVNPDADEWIRFVHHPEGRMLIVDRLAGAAFWDVGPHLRDHRARLARTLPHRLLAEVLASPAVPTPGPPRRIEGRDCVTVDWTPSEGPGLSLHLDREEFLLRAVSYRLDRPVTGDTKVVWVYGDYEDQPGIGRLPAGYRIEVAGRVLERNEVVSARFQPDAVWFSAPEGIEVPEAPPAPDADATVDPTPPPETAEVRELADGVYLVPHVRGGFHVLFVEMADFVVAVDAPAGYHEWHQLPATDWAGPAITSSSVGRRFLATIQATVPDKPVRYLVLTHHHGDHMGGLRPFLAADATLVCADPTRLRVDTALAAEFTLAPDELTGRPVVPRFQLVEGLHTLGDGEREVRVLDLGPNPHAEGLLAVHVPYAGILYVSDVFEPSAPAYFPNPARVPVMRWFVDWLDASGLQPDHIFAVHGSARVTREQLDTIRDGG